MTFASKLLFSFFSSDRVATANLNFNASQQIALENAKFAQTVDLSNLNNEQALVMANELHFHYRAKMKEAFFQRKI